MKHASLDAKTMASKAGIPPFAVKKNLEQANVFSEQELKQTLENGVGLETAVKTGKMEDQIAVELFIVNPLQC